MNLFPMRLKELRKVKKITTEELGKQIGVSQETISKYENGHTEPSIERLIKLTTFFEVSCSYLIGITDERNYKYVPKDYTDLFIYAYNKKVSPETLKGIIDVVDKFKS